MSSTVASQSEKAFERTQFIGMIRPCLRLINLIGCNVCSDYLKIILQYLLPKQALTIFAGCMAGIEVPVVKNYLIRWFIQRYNVNMQEALEENPEHYPHFNAFFIRQLKPGVRPVAAADVVCPVDGFVSEIGVIEQGQMLQAKGRVYQVDDLLATTPLRSALFQKGSFATLYLSPQDYHRVHMPMDAVLREMVHVPGTLFSVQPATTRMIPRLFARNERLVVFFDTHVGPMAMVLVGATIVGAIGTTWHGDLIRRLKRQVFTYDADTTVKTILQKSDEMGYFKLGSTVILLFSESVRMQWEPSLQTGARVQTGQVLGHFQ